MLVCWRVVMPLSFVLAFTTFVVDTAILLLVECHRIGEHICILCLSVATVTPADIRITHAFVKFVVSICFSFISKTANVKVSKIIRVKSIA